MNTCSFVNNDERMQLLSESSQQHPLRDEISTICISILVKGGKSYLYTGG